MAELVTNVLKPLPRPLTEEAPARERLFVTELSGQDIGAGLLAHPERRALD